MDVRDIKEVPVITGNPIVALFGWQKELLDHYISIEGLPQYPINPDMKTNQVLFKDFIGRVVEELGESYESYCMAGAEDMGSTEWLNHMSNATEEVADALHFLLETLIYAGLQPDDLKVMEYPVDTNELELGNISKVMWQVTYHLMIARNCLKNKPWKQTQMITDTTAFRDNLKLSWRAFLKMCAYLQINPLEMVNLYYKKNRVNFFRIKSKY